MKLSYSIVIFLLIAILINPLKSGSVAQAQDPAVEEKITLTSMCHIDAEGTMRLRNPNSRDIEVEYRIYPNAWQGPVVAQAQSDSFFTISWPGTVQIRYTINSAQRQDVKAQNNTICPGSCDKLTLDPAEGKPSLTVQAEITGTRAVSAEIAWDGESDWVPLTNFAGSQTFTEPGTYTVTARILGPDQQYHESEACVGAVTVEAYRTFLPVINRNFSTGTN